MRRADWNYIWKRMLASSIASIRLAIQAAQTRERKKQAKGTLVDMVNVCCAAPSFCNVERCVSIANLEEQTNKQTRNILRGNHCVQTQDVVIVQILKAEECSFH